MTDEAEPTRPRFPSTLKQQLRWTVTDRRLRPRDYDSGLADEIIELVANGEMLGNLCQSDDQLPLPATFLRWCAEEPGLGERYDTARRYAADINFDRQVEEAIEGNWGVSAALRYHAERSMPEKYGPRAVVRVAERPEDDAAAGVDHTAEIRRRIEAMAARRRAEEQKSVRETAEGSPQDEDSRREKQ